MIQRSNTADQQKQSGNYYGKPPNPLTKYIYIFLRLTANLLRKDGVIFLSIGDNEVVNLRKICDEVFGEGIFIGTIISNKQNVENDAIKRSKKS